MKSIVTAKWLVENYKQSNLIVLCAGLVAPNTEAKAIPNAIYFDIKNVFSHTDSAFPNTFPSADYFQEKCQEIGIQKDSLIVVYDDKGIYSSARVWWLFHTMGHQNVAVLDGGLPQWIQNNYPTTIGYQNIFTTGTFTANVNLNAIKNHSFIKNNLINKTHCVIDARSADRFNSVVPEPRAGLRSGKIPNSINIPFQNVLNAGKLKSKSELKIIFNNIHANKPLIFSCGSGITACILALAYSQISEQKTAVYDGSWTEWGTLEDA